MITSTFSTISSKMAGLIYVGTKVDQITDHLRFLYPIVERREDQLKRFEFRNDGLFNGFYKRFQKDFNTFSYFCNMPPVELDEYFTPLDSTKNDEIQGHMHVFSKDEEEYEDLLTKISNVIKDCTKII
jgi:hypothetical protein